MSLALYPQVSGFSSSTLQLGLGKSLQRLRAFLSPDPKWDLTALPYVAVGLIHRKLLEPCPAGSEHGRVSVLADTGLRLPGLFAELASGRSHSTSSTGGFLLPLLHLTYSVSLS